MSPPGLSLGLAPQRMSAPARLDGGARIEHLVAVWKAALRGKMRSDEGPQPEGGVRGRLHLRGDRHPEGPPVPDAQPGEALAEAARSCEQIYHAEC